MYCSGLERRRDSTCLHRRCAGSASESATKWPPNSDLEPSNYNNRSAVWGSQVRGTFTGRAVKAAAVRFFHGRIFGVLWEQNDRPLYPAAKSRRFSALAAASAASDFMYPVRRPELRQYRRAGHRLGRFHHLHRSIRGRCLWWPRSTRSLGNGKRKADLTGEGQCGAEGFGSADPSGEDRTPAAAGRRG